MKKTGITVSNAIKNYDAKLTNKGALAVFSGEYTGRCPSAKKIVKDVLTENTVDWNKNQSMTEEEWKFLLSNLESYISTWKEYGRDFYTAKATAGRSNDKFTDTKVSYKFICENPVQIQFINNMFGEENESEENVSECTVYCVPSFQKTPVVAVNFTEKKIVISGTRYLGEIKKSVFTYMNYMLTSYDVLPMHCSVNVDSDHKNPAVFFGLSGTGKTTLSSSSDRVLLGDDEHGWAPGFIFNIESGCYAKTAGLSVETEPEIFEAANRFGSIFENVVINNGELDFNDTSLTKNGRVSYPLSHIKNHVQKGFVCENPKNVIMLTCDAFGVLPPVSKLTCEKAREMFLLGYTSKVAGTETGVTEPQVVFSACFGAPFLPRNPIVYGDLLEKYIIENDIDCWLVNTGWVGGSYGKGERMNLADTRKIIQSILSNDLAKSGFCEHEWTGFIIPTSIPHHSEIQTFPEASWDSLESYKEASRDLMSQIREKASNL